MISPKTQWQIPVFWLSMSIIALFVGYELGPILKPFGVAFLIAYILNPIVQWLQCFHIPRIIGAFLSVGSLFAIILLACFVIFPLLHEELTLLLSQFPERFSQLLKVMTPFLEQWTSYLSQTDQTRLYDLASASLREAFSWILQLVLLLFSSSSALANILSFILITPLVSFYLLKDWENILTTCLNLIPPAYRLSIQNIGKKIHKTLTEYAKGQAIVCVLLILYYAIGLSVLNLPHSMSIGLVTGMLSFIPYFGFFVGFITALSVALLQISISPSVGSIVLLYTAGYTLEGLILTPYLVGTRAGLPAIWVIFSLLAGGNFLGITGIIFAMPCAAALGVYIRHCIDIYKKSHFYVPSSTP